MRKNFHAGKLADATREINHELAVRDAVALRLMIANIRLGEAVELVDDLLEAACGMARGDLLLRSAAWLRKMGRDVEVALPGDAQ